MPWENYKVKIEYEVVVRAKSDERAIETAIEELPDGDYYAEAKVTDDECDDDPLKDLWKGAIDE